MNRTVRTTVKATTIAALAGCALICGTAAANAATPTTHSDTPHPGAAHPSTPHPNVERRMINANMLNHPVDMKVTFGDGHTVTDHVDTFRGGYPTGDFDGINHIDVIDGGKVVFSATFTFDTQDRYRADWKLISVDKNTIRYTWHTGDFGGFDFR